MYHSFNRFPSMVPKNSSNDVVPTRINNDTGCMQCDGIVYGDFVWLLITQSKIPPESFFPHISKLCMAEWQDSWDSTPTNKLFSIKPVLGKNKPRTSLSRRDETVITRLRISHSRMTHSYLLSRESQPVCDHCKCHMMVKHMLLECPSTAVIRHKYFSSTTLKELFSNVDVHCVLDFTKGSGFHRAI